MFLKCVLSNCSHYVYFKRFKKNVHYSIMYIKFISVNLDKIRWIKIPVKLKVSLNYARCFSIFFLPLRRLILWIFFKKLGKVRGQIVAHKIRGRRGRQGCRWHSHRCRWRCGCCRCSGGCCAATFQPHHGLQNSLNLTQLRIFANVTSISRKNFARRETDRVFPFINVWNNHSFRMPKITTFSSKNARV